MAAGLGLAPPASMLSSRCDVESLADAILALAPDGDRRDDLAGLVVGFDPSRRPGCRRDQDAAAGTALVEGARAAARARQAGQIPSAHAFAGTRRRRRSTKAAPTSASSTATAIAQPAPADNSARSCAPKARPSRRCP